MKKMCKYLAAEAGITMLAGILQAAVVNVDFQPGGSGSTYAVNYSGQGAVSDPGNNTWNIVAPSADAGGGDESGGWFGTGPSQQALIDSTGADSGMTLSTEDGVAIAMSTTHGGYGDLATNALPLMSDYLQMDASGWSRSVFIEGLVPGRTYSLYLYGAGPWNRDTTFAVRLDTDTGANYSTAQWVGEMTTDSSSIADPHVLTEGADYVVFNFTAGTGMDTLWIEYKGDGDGDDMAPFNGLQLATGSFKLFFYK